MRHCALYFVVALLTFGIGSLAVSGSHWGTGENPIDNEEANITVETQPQKNFGTGFGTGSSERRLNEPVNVPKHYKAICRDAKILPIWNALRKDKEFKEHEKVFYQEADCSNAIEIQKTDLNGDWQKEFIVWGRYNFCGGTGNCVLWIYEEKNGKYKQLLQSYAYYGEEKWFEVKKSKTKGYRSLLLKGHFTGYETTYHSYEFNGSRYVESKCLFEIHSMDEENPLIMTCKEYSERTEKQLRESQALP